MAPQVLKKEKKINEFIADLNKLSKKHDLIIDEELQCRCIKVYTKDYELVGEIEYDEDTGRYQKKLSQIQKEIRQEVNNDVDDNKQAFKDLLTVVENLQENFLKTVVGKNPNIVTKEEELIYWVALDKIEDTTEDWDLWDEIRHEPKQFLWEKIKDLHWKVVDMDGEVMIEVTKEDVCRYVDNEVLEKHYSKYL